MQNLLSWAPKLLWMVTAITKLKDIFSSKKNIYLYTYIYDKHGQCIKKQRHHLANKGPYSQNYGFFSSHVQMWDLDHKEGWALEKWSFHLVLLGKTLESLLDCKEIKPVNPKGNQPWIFFERTEAEAETPTLWPLDANSWLFGRLWCWERYKAKW